VRLWCYLFSYFSFPCETNLTSKRQTKKNKNFRQNNLPTKEKDQSPRQKNRRRKKEKKRRIKTIENGKPERKNIEKKNYQKRKILKKHRTKTIYRGKSRT
jgi:hypothetical protein